MLTVYKFGPAWSLPDASPFVVKLETWLRLANLPYRTESGDSRKSPNRKLPYLVDGDRTIADSSLIIDYLKEKYGDRLRDNRLNHVERATARALKSMFESELYFILAYTRWWNEEDFEVYRPSFSGTFQNAGIPRFAQPAVLALIRRQVRGQLEAQGIARYAREDVFAMGRSILESAADLLGDKPYFMGDAISTIDATAYGILSGLLWAPFENPVKSGLLARPNLVQYNERIRDAYWPR